MYGENAMKANEAQSEFARTKTIAQQRAFLPIYGCREHLLNVYYLDVARDRRDIGEM